MALIVEDGTGKEDAESYVSVDFADDYISKMYGDVPEWSGADSSKQEIALRRGCQYVDSYQCRGVRLSADQAKEWPRVGVGVVGGREVGWNVVPVQVKNANVEAALKWVKGAELFPDHYGGTIAAESEGLGPLQESVQYMRGKSQELTFTSIDRLMRAFTALGVHGGLRRGIG